MSYPEPIEFESPESLYRQACFFYNQYEKMKAKYKKVARLVDCGLEDAGARGGCALDSSEYCRKHWKRAVQAWKNPYRISADKVKRAESKLAAIQAILKAREVVFKEAKK